MTALDSLLDRVREQITEIDAEQAHSRLGEAVFVDVRESDERAVGHIAGAVLLPRGRLETSIETNVPSRDTPIVVYCTSGTRSVLAAHTLHTLGYADVASLAGGILAWTERGYEVDGTAALTSSQRARYSRHLLIPEVGEAGQRRLLEASVLLLGAGGLGSPVAYYLAAAGIGTIGIIDDDVVDRSNLQRQILHAEDRIGTPKVESAKATLNALNPDVDVVPYNERLTATNVLSILEGYDVVVDGSDNFATRYLVNDACVQLGIPNVTGSVYRFEGQLIVVKPHEGPCYRCLYPEPPPAEAAPACDEAGVLGVLPGTMGLLQATEVLKLILGIGAPLIGRLLIYNALDQRFRELSVAHDPACRVCGERDGTTEGVVRHEDGRLND